MYIYIYIYIHSTRARSVYSPSYLRPSAQVKDLAGARHIYIYIYICTHVYIYIYIYIYNYTYYTYHKYNNNNVNNTNNSNNNNNNNNNNNIHNHNNNNNNYYHHHYHYGYSGALAAARKLGLYKADPRHCRQHRRTHHSRHPPPAECFGQVGLDSSTAHQPVPGRPLSAALRWTTGMPLRSVWR